ncbi:TniQ family protein [Pseudoalteromonas piscicida]|nr:TniQ family protein [Pseudoalteromonas piscicida]
MACLPVPYPDELLYSVIARYGVHAGITSPKQLLDEVFQNRQIIASVAFQGHLSQISAH